jgi:hypothetical protein
MRGLLGGSSRASWAFVAFDTAKKKHAVAIADVGREGEIGYLDEIDSSPLTIERMIRKLCPNKCPRRSGRPRGSGRVHQVARGRDEAARPKEACSRPLNVGGATVR